MFTFVQNLLYDSSIGFFRGNWPTTSYSYIGNCLTSFWGRKIPELMRGLGSGIKEFKNATKEEEEKQTKKDD